MRGLSHKELSGGANPSAATIFISPRESDGLSRSGRQPGAPPGGYFNLCRCSPKGEAQRRERCQCGCKTCRRYQFSRRGVISKHGGLKIRWASSPVPVQLRPPRPILRPCVKPVDRAVLKTAAPSGAWACNSPRPHQSFRRVVEWIHASLRNSWAQARAGANPVSPTNFRAVKMRLLRHHTISPFPLTRRDAKTSARAICDLRAGRAPGDWHVRRGP